MWSMEQHLQFADKISEQFQMIGDCIEEMYTKKAVFGRKKYRLNSKLDDRFHRKHLWYKQKSRSKWDLFPSMFKYDLDNAMNRLYADDTLLEMNPYFSARKRTGPNVILSDASVMTAEDIAIVHRVNRNYVKVMDEAILQIKLLVPNSKYLKEIVKWRNHVVACTGSKWELVRRHVWRKWAVAHFWLKITGKRIGAPGGRFYTDAVTAYEAE